MDRLSPFQLLSHCGQLALAFLWSLVFMRQRKNEMQKTVIRRSLYLYGEKKRGVLNLRRWGEAEAWAGS